VTRRNAEIAGVLVALLLGVVGAVSDSVVAREAADGTALRAFFGRAGEWAALWASVWISLASVALAAAIGVAAGLPVRVVRLPRSQDPGFAHRAAGGAAAPRRRDRVSLSLRRVRIHRARRAGVVRPARGAVGDCRGLRPSSSSMRTRCTCTSICSRGGPRQTRRLDARSGAGAGERAAWATICVSPCRWCGLSLVGAAILTFIDNRLAPSARLTSSAVGFRGHEHADVAIEN